MKFAQAGKLLIDGLSGLKPDQLGSEEVKAALAALKALAPVMPEVAEGLGTSEIQGMLAGAQPVKTAGAPPTMLGTPRPTPGGLGLGRMPMARR